MTTFSEELEKDFQRMVFVLENVENACWVYAVYNQAAAREEIIKRLKSEIQLPFFSWDYSEEKPYPLDYLRELTEEQKQNRAIVSFFNTVDGGDKTIKSLDFNREKFAEYPHSLVFWVTENELGKMARKAGHFWAQRRGTFNFSKLVIVQSEQNYPYGVGAWLNNLVNIDNYQDAQKQLDFYQQLLNEYPVFTEKLPINTQRLIAETNDKISYLLYCLGRYSEAIGFGEKSLNMYRTLLGDNDDTVAISNNLALIYRFDGNDSKSEQLLLKSLDILENVINNALAKATVLNNLASLYRGQRKYVEAEQLFQQSLAIREKIWGKEHPDIAASLNNFANLYYEQGKYDMAESLYMKSLSIKETTLGEKHPDIATTLYNLARFYNFQGKYLKAESLYQRAFSIAKKSLGIDHPSTKYIQEDYEQFLAEQAARNKSNQP